MKKAALALTTLAALTVTTVALAHEPQEEGPTSTSAGASFASDVAAKAPPQASAKAAAPSPQTSITMLSSADATATPLPVMPPPARETLTLRQAHRPNRTLLYAGGATLIGSYAATAAVTFTRRIHDSYGDQSLLIPVAGPWLHLANTKETMLHPALIAGSGVAQGAGLVIGALSLIIPEHVPAVTIQAGGVKMQLTASSPGKGSAGVGVVGQF